MHVFFVEIAEGEMEFDLRSSSHRPKIVTVDVEHFTAHSWAKNRCGSRKPALHTKANVM